MSERRDDLLDEAVIRLALRFEADEPRPRFDAAALAAAARAARPERGTMAIAFAATAVTGLVAGAAWSFIFGVVPSFESDAIAALVQGVAALVTLLVPIAQLAAEPVVPMSLLAVMAVAILHELRERREHAHAQA